MDRAGLLLSRLFACSWVRSGVFAFPGRTPAITSQLASPIRRPIGFRGRRGVQSLPVPRLGSRKRKSARTAERCQGRDDDAGPGEVALVESPPPAPQSKPVTLAPRLVARTAPLVAFGLGLRILAAGPAPYRQYSDRGSCVSQPKFVHNQPRSSTEARADPPKLSVTRRAGGRRGWGQKERGTHHFAGGGGRRGMEGGEGGEREAEKGKGLGGGLPREGNHREERGRGRMREGRGRGGGTAAVVKAVGARVATRRRANDDAKRAHHTLTANQTARRRTASSQDIRSQRRKSRLLKMLGRPTY